MGGSPSKHTDQGYVFTYYIKPYLAGRNQFPATIYALVVSRPDGNTNSFIQYWILYYANDHPEAFHEGDWEVVQIDLDGDLKPYRAHYSQHGRGKWRNWNGPGSVEKSSSDPNRPVVYVARGSHANYFYPDGHSIYWHDVSIPGVWDDAHGDGVTLNEPANPTLGKNTSAIVVPEVGQSFGGPFAWLQFQGLWGEFTGAWLGAGHVDVVSGERDGSQSPPVQDYWKNAFAWPSESCDGCQDLQAQGTDMEVTAFSPLDIHLYDSQGHHTGKNSDGSIDKQIPGSEYLEYPDLHRKSIIVHGSDISTGYKFEATGNGRGTADLIVTAPDHHQNNVQTLNYNAIQVNPSTKVIMNLDLDKNYMASVDTYGNGAEVMQKAPDKTTTSNVDFTPPAKITDLAVTAITSGTATLTFTAPGDDESTGTATSYDLRYSTSAITDQYLSEATPAADLPAPLQASATQTATVTGLKPGTTYYFAIKAIDKEGLFSPISNIATAITTIPSLA